MRKGSGGVYDKFNISVFSNLGCSVTVIGSTNYEQFQRKKKPNNILVQQKFKISYKRDQTIILEKKTKLWQGI
jgi:hypothetical protein